MGLASALLVTALLEQSLPVGIDSRVRVACNTGYVVERCVEQERQLRAILATFDLQDLGPWTWVLVRTVDWRPILRRVGRDPDSPGFTILEKRQTFLEEALFVPTPNRDRIFLEKWRVPLDHFPRFVVAHELGHALCLETDERRARATAEELLRSRSVECK
jgi:hypothetical protein